MAEDKTTQVVNKLTELKKAYKEAMDAAAAGSDLAAASAEKLKGEIDKVDSSLNKFANNETFDAISMQVSDTTKKINTYNDALDDTTSTSEKTASTLRGMTKELKRLRDEQANVVEGSKRWKVYARQINDVEGKIGDLNDSFKTMAGSGMEKSRASFGLLKEGLNNLDFGKVKIGLTGLRVALASTGIMLLVQGVMYLYENFDKLSKSSGFLGKYLSLVGDYIKMVTGAIEYLLDKLGIIDIEANKMSEAIVNTAKKNKEAIAQQSKEYDRQIAAAEASGKTTVQIELDKQHAIIRTNLALFRQLQAYVKSGHELTDEQKELYKEALESNKEAFAAMDVIKNKQEKKNKDDRKKSHEDRKKDEEDLAKKLAEIRIQNIKDEETRELDTLRFRDDEERKAIEKSKANREQKNLYLKELDIKYQNEVDAIQERFRVKREQEEEAIRQAKIKADEAEKQRILAIKKWNDDIESKDFQDLIKSAKEKYELNGKTYKDELNLIKVTHDVRIALAKKTGETIERIEHDTNEAIFAAQEKRVKGFSNEVNKYGAIANQSHSSLVSIVESMQAIEENRLKEYTDGLDHRIDALNEARDAELEKEGLTEEERKNIKLKYDLAEYQLELEKYDRETEVKKKAFEQNKKLQIANTIVTTIQGAVTAFANAFQLGPIAGPIVGGIQAALIAASGAAQIAKIKSTKFDAGSPPSPPKVGGSGIPSGGSGVKPQSGPTLFKVGERNEPKNEPVKAYVVSQEVESSTNKSKVIKRRASI